MSETNTKGMSKLTLNNVALGLLYSAIAFAIIGILVWIWNGGEVVLSNYTYGHYFYRIASTTDEFNLWSNIYGYIWKIEITLIIGTIGVAIVDGFKKA